MPKQCFHTRWAPSMRSSIGPSHSRNLCVDLSRAMPQDNCLSLKPHAPLEKFCSTPDVEHEVASQPRIAFS
eukprot:9142798-Pyramimonas_sp.AAC.1